MLSLRINAVMFGYFINAAWKLYHVCYADGPQTVEVVIQLFQTVALLVGLKCSLNPSLTAL